MATTGGATGGSGCVVAAVEGADGLIAGATGTGGADWRAAGCGAGGEGHNNHASTAASASNATAVIATGARRFSAR